MPIDLQIPFFKTAEISGQGLECRRLLQQPDGSGALVAKNFFTPEQSSAMVETVDKMKAHYNPGSRSGEYTIGRVFYTSNNTDDTEGYFEEAAESRTFIQREFPGVEEKVLDFCRQLAGDNTVKFRDGWAGPAFVLFTGQSETAKTGLFAHIDFDGIPPMQVDLPELESYSFICPIKLPAVGGNLRIWPGDRYKPDQKYKYFVMHIEPLEGPMLVLPYEIGNLYAIDSMMAHEVEAWNTGEDRICLTFHLAKIDGLWQVWF